MSRFIWPAILFLISLGFLTVLLGMGGVFWYLGAVARDLPDYEKLKDYDPPQVTRAHTGDGRLMAEFATERRVFVPISEIPPLVVRAFLSAEDQNFYTHPGVDYIAIARAALSNLRHAGSGKRPMGASTITQQVAKNLLLTNEVSYERKIKEALLAFRLEQALSKERILELYLNQIYLGSGNYGVAAAAIDYFNKSLAELTPAEAAYLAALPKAPNNYNPVRNPEGAVARRNWVLSRMREDGVITREEEEAGAALAISFAVRADDVVTAPYFAEEIRREIKQRYGDEALYRGGLSVRSTIDPHLQSAAEDALRKGLMAYDMKHGWRGPVARMDPSILGRPDLVLAALKKFGRPQGLLPTWTVGVVTKVTAGAADILRVTGDSAKILAAPSAWADRSAPDPQKVDMTRVVKPGDIVMVEPDNDTKAEDDFLLRQAPKIQGAIVAMDPHTGRVLAMQGGWIFEGSEFNRVTQAWRQPGSAFKPFIYLAALDHGFTPSSLILDAPITFRDALGRIWEPKNYSDDYGGPSTLRVGIEKSRNLMTVRLADRIGMKTVVDYAEKFGIVDTMEPHLANALGSTETTLLRLTTAYGMLVNGGRKINAHFIDRIQGRRGNDLYRADNRICEACGPRIRWEGQDTPSFPDLRQEIADPRSAYQMVSIMEGVVARGTARKLSDMGRPMAGKTGTTNDSRDVWFIGFTPDLVAGVFVGYDSPRGLGEKETGGAIAVPIFRDFMTEALKDSPPIPFRMPPGVRQVMVDAATGRRADFGVQGAIWESYIEGTEPSEIDVTENLLTGSSEQTEWASKNEIGNTDYILPAPYTPPKGADTPDIPTMAPPLFGGPPVSGPSTSETQGIY